MDIIWMYNVVKDGDILLQDVNKFIKTAEKHAIIEKIMEILILMTIKMKGKSLPQDVKKNLG